MPVPSSQAEDELCDKLFHLTTTLNEMSDPDQILDSLHAITSQACKINVQAAFLLPEHWGDLSEVALGKNVFVHKSVPDGWWQEYFEGSHDNPSPAYAEAQLTMAPFTLTELMQNADPVGTDRWAIELAQRYGIRDSLACPVGGRWVLAFWSSDVMTARLTPYLRALLFMAANFVIIRLQEIVGSRDERPNKNSPLTPRELAVLRSLSLGYRSTETAARLHIQESTVRSHLRKALDKLGVRTPTQAVAHAIRRRLVP